MISNMAQRARMRLRRTRVPAANMAVVTGSATSDVASGFIAASGRNTSDVNGGNRKPIAASFGGSLCQTKYARVRRSTASKTTTWESTTMWYPSRPKPSAATANSSTDWRRLTGAPTSWTSFGSWSGTGGRTGSSRGAGGGVVTAVAIG